MARPRIPKAEIHKPEILEEHENLEKAVRAALVITATAGVYHYFSRSGRGFSYIRPVYRDSLKVGEDGRGLSEEPVKFSFELGIKNFNEQIKRLFGQISPPDGRLERVDEAEITIEENTGVTPMEIQESIIDDVADSGYQNPLQNP